MSFRILKVLEARNSGEDVGYAAWIWVGALGLNKLLDAGVQSFLYWLSWMGLGIPIRSQLSAVIFRKTLLKKDVKGSQKAEDAGDEQGQPTISSSKQESEDEDELKNMKQGKINLLAIDATRIADLASFSNIFAESIFGVIMCITFPFIELISLSKC